MGTFVQRPAAQVITDQNGYTLSSSNPLPVNPAESGAANFAATQVSVAATATQIVASNATRRAVLITNPSSSVTVYIGGAAVTTSTGQELLPGNSLSLPVTSAVYGIVATSTQTVSAVEVYD